MLQDENDLDNVIERVVPAALLIYATGEKNGYWRTALGRHFRDSSIRIFEFHSDDPTSWDEFFEYVNPGILFKPPMSVAKANAVLPWAHRFMMSDLVALCGEAYAAHISDLAEMNSVSDEDTGVRFDECRTDSRQVIDMLVLLQNHNRSHAADDDSTLSVTLGEKEDIVDALSELGLEHDYVRCALLE